MSDPLGAISRRVARIRAGEDPELLARVPSGWAILGKYQPEPVLGCCMLLPDPVVASPNDLATEARAQFFGDLVLLGDAILAVTGAERINYLVLCNQVPELHGHCIPRFESEDPALRLQGPFEAYDFGGARTADVRGRDRGLHAALAAELKDLLETSGIRCLRGGTARDAGYVPRLQSGSPMPPSDSSPGSAASGTVSSAPGGLC